MIINRIGKTVRENKRRMRRLWRDRKTKGEGQRRCEEPTLRREGKLE